jgi:hypothetical protein
MKNTIDAGNTMRVWLPYDAHEQLRVLSQETGLTQSLIAQLLCRAGLQAIQGKPFYLPFKFKMIEQAPDGVRPIPHKKTNS